MKELQVFPRITPEPSWLGKLFRIRYVESGFFTYSLQIKNIGDEPVGQSDLGKIEFVWHFGSLEGKSDEFSFDRAVAPKDVMHLGPFKRRVKLPGEAWLGARLWVTPGLSEVRLRAADGTPVRIPHEGVWTTDPDDKQKYYVNEANGDFFSFWSASATEVKQMLAIVVAAAGLLVASIVGAINLLHLFGFL